jgi:TolA-binding protein
MGVNVVSQFRVGLVLTLGMGSVAAFAQAPAAPPAAPPAAEVKGSDSDIERIPNSEKVKNSAQSLTKMRDSLRDVIPKLEEARATKDVVKLNCVNDKLTQIKGLLRISEQSDVTLQEAIAKKEDIAINHEYRKVTLAGDRVKQLRAEAEECIGQLAFRTDQNTNVDVNVPDDLPKGDPTVVLTPPYDLRQPPASPTL